MVAIVIAILGVVLFLSFSGVLIISRHGTEAMMYLVPICETVATLSFLLILFLPVAIFIYRFTEIKD